ncbi:MAG TPA: hypothetical protein VFP11_04420 [Candidatus Angelobacter sp.]|nr:hypothetical protein [Candidatus Angelobacter sp.]
MANSSIAIQPAAPVEAGCRQLMRKDNKMKRIWRLLLICLSATVCSAQIQITLTKDFVDKFANRATIDTNFTVSVTSKIHPASQDGDIHVAGVAPEIGMVAVAEVMNAKTEKTKAVKVLVDAAGSGSPVKISGAWRIWCEHGGEQHYIQNEPVSPPTNSGQAHVFEVHPITSVNGKNIGHTWDPIPGFTYKDADQAFPIYERTRSTITDQGPTIMISTEQVGFNYTEFIAKLNETRMRCRMGFQRLRKSWTPMAKCWCTIAGLSLPTARTRKKFSTACIKDSLCR